MATFSERNGHRELRTHIQNESLDDETRVALWNLLDWLRTTLQSKGRAYQEPTHELLSLLWTEYLKKPRDEMPLANKAWSVLKNHVLRGEWFEVLDLLEETSQIVAVIHSTETASSGRALPAAFIEYANDCFEQYLVGYRFIGHEIAPIDSETSVQAITDAIEHASPVPGAQRHLKQAVELLANRQDPDYPNSVKESISAVEAVTAKFTGKTTLSAGLKELEKAGLSIHPVLHQAWGKLYAWTSDENGVRHGAADPATIDQAMAKFMLVSCSAFVSYLIEEGGKVGLL